MTLLIERTFNIMTTKNKKSPCIDICKFQGPKGWCLGCGRTREECQKWKNLKTYDIKILKKQLIKRMLIIEN
tara:strand:- start:189 stop:404 length:216 start_codon:yes stop_codon:yes gene_type:complete